MIWGREGESEIEPKNHYASFDSSELISGTIYESRWCLMRDELLDIFDFLRALSIGRNDSISFSY